MKLSEYIYEKLIPPHSWDVPFLPSEEEINQWIIEWYQGEFTEVGCDGDLPKARLPPTWLADWRKKNEESNSK